MGEIKIRPAVPEELEQASWVRRWDGKTSNKGNEFDSLYNQLSGVLNSGMGTALVSFSENVSYGARQGFIIRLRQRAAEDGTKLQISDSGDEVFVRRLQLREVGEQEYNKDI